MLFFDIPCNFRRIICSPGINLILISLLLSPNVKRRPNMLTVFRNPPKILLNPLVQQLGLGNETQDLLLSTFLVENPFQILKVNFVILRLLLLYNFHLLQMVLNHLGVIIVLDFLVHKRDQTGTSISPDFIPTSCSFQLQFFLYCLAPF